MSGETVEPGQVEGLGQPGLSTGPGQVFDESEQVSLWALFDPRPNAEPTVWSVTTQPLTVGAPPKSCTDTPMLVIEGVGVTDAEGMRELSVNDFYCPQLSDVKEPAFLLATADTDQPVYMTAQVLWRAPNDLAALRFFSWGIAGKPAPEVVFNWQLTIAAGFLVL